MPPPKARLHNKTGKLKNINKAYSIPSSGGQETSGNSSRRNNRTAENTVTQSVARTNPSTSTPSTPTLSPIASSSDTTQQFEIELCWCVQTLEKGLEAGNISAKQGLCVRECVQFYQAAKFHTSLFLFSFSPRYGENHSFVEKCQSTDNKKTSNYAHSIR